jgi:hypothetical protein
LICIPWPIILKKFPQGDPTWAAVVTNVPSACHSNLWSNFQEVKMVAASLGQPILVVDLTINTSGDPGSGPKYTLQLHTPFFDAYEVVKFCNLSELPGTIFTLMNENPTTLVVLYNGKDHYNAVVRGAVPESRMASTVPEPRMASTKKKLFTDDGASSRLRRFPPVPLSEELKAWLE